MRKMKLAIDALRVSTFEVSPGDDHRGTVAAHNPASQSHCGPTYGFEESCDYTCPASCGPLGASEAAWCTALTNVCGGCNGV